MFLTRLAIDLGVPAVSLKQIFRTILAFESHYKQELFYRQIIQLLKTNDTALIQRKLEEDRLPEKLLLVTKYTELGYVLYDYPNSLKQAEK